ncbi:MAG: hypothetical protein P1U32_07690 [Legionellaceae bacterium]|nr:hypothetical protein [Legionellaceae bacterium]
MKELALRKIKTIAEANVVLEKGFIDRLNEKFSKPPRNPHSAHLILEEVDLNQVFCWEYTRKLQNDWTFAFSNQLYQVKKAYGLCIKPKSEVIIRRHLNGSMSVWHGSEKLSFKAISERPVVHAKTTVRTQKTKRASSAWTKTNAFLFQSTSNVRSALTKGMLKKRSICKRASPLRPQSIFKRDQRMRIASFGHVTVIGASACPVTTSLVYFSSLRVIGEAAQCPLKATRLPHHSLRSGSQ